MQSFVVAEETQSTAMPTGAGRVQENFLAYPERKLLNWFCLHMPRAVTPDGLTLVGILGAVLVLGSYAASKFHPIYLWLATIGLIVQWFGDSLDGSLARYRGDERPRYGYFLDHSVDAISGFMIMVGAGLSGYIRLDVALFALLGYFMLSMYQFLYNHVSQTFQLSFLALGPTEVRIGLIGINCWMYFADNSKVMIGDQTFSPYDLVLCVTGTVLMCLFVVSVFSVARKLRLEEALHKRASRF